MKLLKDGDRLIYRYPDFTMASWLLRALPLGLGLYGVVGVLLSNPVWDDILFIPLGISAALILGGLFGFYRLLRQRRLPQLTRALIFDGAAGRMYLSPDAWKSDTPPADLKHLPSYGYDQFDGWFLRTYTVSRGNDRMSKSTYYVVSLRKTDGGHFDVMESGFEPHAEAVLRELSAGIPLEASQVNQPHTLPLPQTILKQERFQETLYTWNKAFSLGSYASALLFVAVAAAGYFLVIGSAEGRYADLIRLSLGATLSLTALIIIVLGVSNGLRANGRYEYLLLRRGTLEYGEVPRDEAKADQKKIKKTIGLGSVVRVRYDRALDRRNVTALWLQTGDTEGLFLALDGLSEGEAVILEQSLEHDIRHYGGSSE